MLSLLSQNGPIADDGSDSMTTTTKTKKNAAAVALGRLGGAAGTRAQNRARKKNAQLAGRPRRICTTCGEPVAGGHVDRRLDETCGAHGWRWQQRRGGPPSRESLIAMIETHKQAIA